MTSSAERNSSAFLGKFTNFRIASTSRSRPPRQCTIAVTFCRTTWKSARWATEAAIPELHPAYESGAPTSDAKSRTASWATRRVNDGKGFLFISHTGNVYPSGFLPIHAGNIRETPLSEIYRNAPIFKSLRDTSKLEGKCGACEYKEICGGSRARAYAVTGDPLAQEPCCIYQPKNWDPELEHAADAFRPTERPETLVTL